MIQWFNILFWARPRAESDEAAARRVLAVCDALREFAPEFAPNFERAYSKRKARAFDFTESRVLELIDAGRNREGGRVLESLGSRLGFFSSMKNDDSAGISLSVNMTDTRFPNVLDVACPVNAGILTGEHPFTPARLEALFCRLSELWDPYWGCFANGRNLRRFPEPFLSSQGHPTVLHWLNFFNEEMGARLGLLRPADISPAVVTRMTNGVLLKLLPEPLDDDNPQHLAVQSRLTELICARRR